MADTDLQADMDWLKPAGEGFWEEARKQKKEIAKGHKECQQDIVELMRTKAGPSKRRLTTERNHFKQECVESFHDAEERISHPEKQ